MEKTELLDLEEEIKKVLKTVPEREPLIIENYFWIDMDRPLARERVQQLKEKAIKRLQHATQAHQLRAFLG